MFLETVLTRNLFPPNLQTTISFVLAHSHNYSHVSFHVHLIISVTINCSLPFTFLLVLFWLNWLFDKQCEKHGSSRFIFTHTSKCIYISVCIRVYVIFTAFSTDHISSWKPIGAHEALHPMIFSPMYTPEEFSFSICFNLLTGLWLTPNGHPD
jgi:hypothetical protein